MKIAFLLHNVYAVGGTVRTTLNLAAALVEHGGHEVEIVSMSRHREKPRFAVDPRISLVPLVDTRAGSADTLDAAYREPARDFPAAEKRYKQYTLLHDQRVRAYLEDRCTADVVVGTRPGINVYLALWGPRRALKIGQEHLRHDAHGKKLRDRLARHYRRLDALVTMTEADAAVYRSRMSLPGVRVLSVPNIVPPVTGPLCDGTSKIVAAAGRLAPGKRFDLLLEAFAEVAAEAPDWELRIYGGGAQEPRLRALVADLGLTGRVRLMGTVSPIEPEFARAALVVSASDAESFGMTLVEAMRCGTPVISTDAPLGPAEIITDGVDGRLVPVGDARALAEAMLELIGDPAGRARMGAAALASAHRYDPEPIVARYDSLFMELRASRRRRAWQKLCARTTNWARRKARSLRAARSGGPGGTSHDRRRSRAHGTAQPGRL
ncbi:glycosyltransferase family 4 protein [Streptomyces sp. NPDC102406]|uniref:glycosyltransferase family 4 protein n=1 Tax=Streptomyces sp. NPDC102406 TaxID=3366171 RepID=UPI0037F5135A